MGASFPGFSLAIPFLLIAATLAGAGEMGVGRHRLIDGLAAPFKALHRQPPATGVDDCIERLGAELEWLEHQIDLHGSIVAKTPDVWGQNRLVRHRLEYEEQLRLQLPRFEQHAQAAIRRSDQSFLGMALALQSASGRRRPPELIAAPEATVMNSVQALLPTTNEQVGRSDPVVIARTAPFAGVDLPPGMRFEDAPLALEPTLQLDHLSRYVNHLHELRRINEGDDSADSPGYALNLVRIPISITPGQKTRKGHGAEVTITADPQIDDALLPTTVRDLVINDLVDLVAPALTHCVNDPDCLAWADTILAPAEPGRERAGVMAAMRSLAERLPAITPSTAPSMKSRRARMPIPVSQLAEVAGVRQIAVLVQAARRALGAHPAARPCIEYVDVRGYLADELDAAYDFLALDRHRDLWGQLPGWRIADLVRGRRQAELAEVRCHALSTIGTGVDTADPPAAGLPEMLDTPPAAGLCCDDSAPAELLCRSVTAALAWGILVESALLDERLAQDMRDSGVGACGLSLVGPDPAPEARAAFRDYVRRRWPVRVFALDPAIDEQTVDDAFARRRELQIATALAYASGRLNAQAIARYTRRVEADMSVVALNRTVVGFAHGADTFGWRFMPRVQTPPTRGQLAALGETLCGPSADADLMRREIEPGMRECVAIVVMPSFVPRLTLDVQTRWFSLAHPAATEPGVRHTLKLSRAVKAMERSAAACGRCAHLYRDGQVAHLMRRVEQLQGRLPQQVLEARIPHENTSGGFELFDAGVSDLAPELVGWYGAPGVDPAAGTTLFLIGKGFSIHDTRVIAGGRPARFRLLSREVMEVEVPPGVQVTGQQHCSACATEVAQREVRGSANARRALGRRGPREETFAAPEPAWAPGSIVPVSSEQFAEPLPPPAAALPSPFPCHDRAFVDIHLATPYGVTSHLLVPVARRLGPGDSGCALAFAEANALRLTFTVGKAAGTRTEAARIDEFFVAEADQLVIRAPEAFVPPAKAALQFVLRDESSGATAAEFSFDALAFDARAGAYVIAGGDLRNFVGDTSRPATDKTLRGALKPYLDALLARGEIAADGDAIPFTLTATLVADGQRVAVAGAIPVAVSRRGKTVVDPTPAE